MSNPRSIEVRLLQVLGGIAVVAVLGVLAILPYRLYERDIRNAKVAAHRLSAVVHVALGQALTAGQDPAELIQRLQGVGDMQIRLSKLSGEDAATDLAGGPGTSELSGTDLVYVAPPLPDPRGGAWRAEMHFDLSPMKRDSVRLIIDLVLAVAIGSAVFSAVVFLLVRRSLVVPLRELAETIDRRHPEPRDVAMPEFQSREMCELVAAVERACGAHPPRA